MSGVKKYLRRLAAAGGNKRRRRSSSNPETGTTAADSSEDRPDLEDGGGGGGAVELMKDAGVAAAVGPALETDPLLLGDRSAAATKTAAATSSPIDSNGSSSPPPSAATTKPETESSILHDAYDTIALALPIFVAMVSWVGMKTTDTALLGHVGPEALSAAALSDLYTMCTGVLVQGRVLRILVGQAVGAGNPKLAGAYLQVSYFVLGLLTVPVAASWLATKWVWRSMGQGDDVTADAGYYATVLALSLPGQVAFAQLSQFFSSQRIMHPEVVASSTAMAMNLLLGLVLVLGVGIPNFAGFGFTACPWVTTAVVYVQITLLWYVFCHRRGLHRPCWDGWDASSITPDRVKTFCALYFPAALGSASDFWRMGVIGALAAQLGKMEVGVFNASYRIMWIVLILVNALATAAGIKMSLRLGGGDGMGARRAGIVGIALSVVVLTALSVLVASHPRTFGMIFSNDVDFLDMFEECSAPFVATLFFMNLSVAIEQVPMSMGRTAEVFWMGFVASWFGQVPGVFLLTRYWRDDLTGLYTGMALGYVMLTVLYGAVAVTSDWMKYADIAIQRSEAAGKE